MTSTDVIKIYKDFAAKKDITLTKEQENTLLQKATDTLNNWLEKWPEILLNTDTTDRKEFTGQLIDILEDTLSDETTVQIKGSDYDDLSKQITQSFLSSKQTLR